MKLALARYRFTYRMAAPLRLPAYAGSLLRGQFGAALRSLSCVTGRARCEGCPLRATCPYAAVFEAPAPAEHSMQRFSHVPNPYVLEPPPLGTSSIAGGEAFSFNLVLFGRALDQLPLISLALQRAAEQGLGRDRVPGSLERIEVESAPHRPTPGWTEIWQRGKASIAKHPASIGVAPVTAADSGNCATIRLVFNTPLRLQHQGQPLHPHALTPRKLIADLLRRATLLAEFHAGRAQLIPDAPALVRHAEALAHEHDLRWHDWSRYSSRQQREMKLGGVLGNWTLHGRLAPLLPWLELGQWLHVGKNATLGLGAYRLHHLAQTEEGKSTVPRATIETPPASGPCVDNPLPQAS